MEGPRGTEGDGPTERNIGGAAVNVLVNCKTGINAGTVDLFALLIEAAHRWPHTFRADGNHIDVAGEVFADALQVAQQKAVGETQRGARAHGGKNFFVTLRGGGISNQHQHQIRLGNDLIHFAERAIGDGKADRFRLCHRRRVGAQTDLHNDVGANQGIP